MTALVFGQTLCRAAGCPHAPLATGHCAEHGGRDRSTPRVVVVDLAVPAGRCTHCAKGLRRNNASGFCRTHNYMGDAHKATRRARDVTKARAVTALQVIGEDSSLPIAISATLLPGGAA